MKPWQRVLYVQQAYPDNHIDASFLSNLKKNGISCILTVTRKTLVLIPFLLLAIVGLRLYTYTELVYGTLPVTQHVSSILIFVAVFAHLYQSELILPKVEQAVTLLMGR